MKEEEILLCVEWINEQEITQTINTKHESYQYKHIVENWAGTYISEDSFIEALKIKEIPIRNVPWTEKSVYAALSEKTIRRYRDRQVGRRYGIGAIIPALKRTKHE